MKLAIAIVQDKDVAKLLRLLIEKGVRATKLASTGGFLREGNTTLLIGVDDEQVEEVLGLIAEKCKSRKQLVTPISPIGGPVDSYVPYPVEVVVGGATVFVVNIERVERL